MKFGISFTATMFNQAGALVLIYRDGSVQVNHARNGDGAGATHEIQQNRGRSLGRGIWTSSE